MKGEGLQRDGRGEVRSSAAKTHTQKLALTRSYKRVHHARDFVLPIVAAAYNKGTNTAAVTHLTRRACSTFPNTPGAIVNLKIRVGKVRQIRFEGERLFCPTEL